MIIKANHTPGTHAFSGQPGDDTSAARDVEHPLPGRGAARSTKSAAQSEAINGAKYRR
jgi:hypothetical protein